jgi:hypothetical protein
MGTVSREPQAPDGAPPTRRQIVWPRWVKPLHPANAPNPNQMPTTAHNCPLERGPPKHPSGQPFRFVRDLVLASHGLLSLLRCGRLEEGRFSGLCGLCAIEARSSLFFYL